MKTYLLAFRKGDRMHYYVEHSDADGGYLNVRAAWATHFGSLEEAVAIGQDWIADATTWPTTFSVIEHRVEHRVVYNSAERSEE